MLRQLLREDLLPTVVVSFLLMFPFSLFFSLLVVRWAAFLIMAPIVSFLIGRLLVAFLRVHFYY